jgi:small neutral amino acid transporter SnatA (MarC family)
MLATATLTLKKIITLFALVEPVAMIPIFVAASEGLDIAGKVRFARTIAVSVTIALLVATFLGMPLLALLGVSIGAMQVGGGIIVLLLAIAMVLGKETSFKGMPITPDEHGVRQAAVVPLAVPLLAGPAAFSYVMANSSWSTYPDLIHPHCRLRLLADVSHCLQRGAANSQIHARSCRKGRRIHPRRDRRGNDGHRAARIVSGAEQRLTFLVAVLGR